MSSCLQEDLLIHGDSVYDIIDKQDHASIQSELMRGLQPENTSASILDNGNEKRIFLCRMNVSRNARRQMRFGDQKVTLQYSKELSEPGEGAWGQLWTWQGEGDLLVRLRVLEG